MIVSTSARVAVITVFHNSAVYFDRYVAALCAQTRRPDLVILIDSGSNDSTYLNPIKASGLNYRLEFRRNVGFCEGNNLGYALSGDIEYIFFLNPDGYPESDYIEKCLGWFQSASADVGVVSGALVGFDIQTGKATGKLDSTGIVREWSGRIADRDQGKLCALLATYPPSSEAAALCGAAMFCKRQALESVAINGSIFDESFFAYKEDIDLSWRLRDAGWKLLFFPSGIVYHCRGWKRRKDVPIMLKLLSARNEVRLYRKHKSLYIIPALLKYYLVRTFSL